MKKTALFLLLCAISTALQAQTPPDSLIGLPLRTWIRNNYFVGQHTTLSYSGARSKMYAYCDNINGKITCVYGGLQVSHTYGDQGLTVTPLNCEHTIPQSFFNSASPMVSDIHHLFPAYDSWNSLRSNYPFYECNDATTQVWITGTTQLTTMPTTNINDYSEYYAGTFEPREVHKGNVARAVAYFYTMYPTEAGAIYSVLNANTMCNWNDMDVVDAAELTRNTKAATYQGNRNPYIDHPDWVVRAWCPQLLATESNISKGAEIQAVMPNPSNGFTKIVLLATENMKAQVEVVSTTGAVVLSQNDQFVQGENTIQLQLQNIVQGCYFVKITSAKGVVTKPIVIIP
jgi:Endonuclease I/Secretion system C-terminal sorting domain